MRNGGWKGSFLAVVAAAMFTLITACEPSESVVQTAIAQTAVQQMTLEATMSTPTYTPSPTETPIPPTDTPVPTPTEIKVSIMDEEEDCAVITGVLGEDGCQVDLASVTLLPCEKPDLYTFKVEFHTLQDASTTNICSLINADGDPDTGYEADGFPGVDFIYCWLPQSREILVDTFGVDGDLQETLSVSIPLKYILGDPDFLVETRELGIRFPASELGSVVIDPNASAVVEVLHFDDAGNMIYDAISPIGIIGCPIE